MMGKRVIAALIALPLLTACQSSLQSPRDSGMAEGAVPDRAFGPEGAHGTTQAPAPVGSVAVGAFLENSVSAYMDRNDMLKTAQVLETTRNGQVTTWRNRDTGQWYTVTPTRMYDGPSGPCREFTTIARLDDGRHKMVHATACRQPDGTWKSA
jgi:surface antigen